MSIHIIAWKSINLVGYPITKLVLHNIHQYIIDDVKEYPIKRKKLKEYIEVAIEKLEMIEKSDEKSKK